MPVYEKECHETLIEKENKVSIETKILQQNNEQSKYMQYKK